MTHIIAYTYEADVHCPYCTLNAFMLGGADRDRGLHHKPITITPRFFDRDEHGLPVELIDSDGNPVHPVFTTDEHDFTHCGECGQPI
jgi:hypothetical protein